MRSPQVVIRSELLNVSLSWLIHQENMRLAIYVFSVTELAYTVVWGFEHHKLASGTRGPSSNIKEEDCPYHYAFTPPLPVLRDS